MAENQKFFQISTLPKRSGLGGRISKLYRKRQLVISVIGAYVLIGGLLGFLLFNSANDSAKAGNETARITPVIDLLNSDEDLDVGDTVELKLTLQNRSNTESINNLTAEFFSTKNSVSWSEMQVENKETTPILGQNSVFKLPILSSGERVVYTAKGTLLSDETNFLTILAKIRYINKEGQQEVNSNRVFTELEKTFDASTELITTSLPKDAFLPGEEIPVTLAIPNSQTISSTYELSGRLYISRVGSSEIVESIRCEFDSTGICSRTITGLDSGSYTAMFIDDSETVFSDIANFAVDGDIDSVAINPQATLSFPFGSRSINGIVPVYASRVISLNDVVDPDDLCTFEIVQGETVITTVRANIESDRSCQAVINATQIPNGDGLYTVRLQGSTQQREVSFIRKPVSLIQLQTSNTLLTSSTDVDLLATGITDIGGQPISGQAVTLGIWHQSSGEYTELQNQNGESFAIENGQFNARISASNFAKGGLYSVYIFTEDSRQSDFLNLSFDDNQVGFVYSGVIVDDYSNLQIGKDITFTLQDIRDRGGNAVSDSVCSAGLYTKSSSATPAVVGGAIENGNCVVRVPAGTITQSGPLLVSFTAPEINDKINQSRHFMVAPGDVQNFGELRFEYEPVRKNYANNVILGPVTDQFGNLTQAFDLRIDVENAEGVIYTLDDIAIDEGYAVATIPSSILRDDTVTLKLKNSAGEELVVREATLVENTEPLILPSVPDVLSGDDNLEVSIRNDELTAEDVCNVSFKTSLENILTQEVPVDGESGVCSLDWDITTSRNVDKAMVIIVSGSNTYNSVIELQSGEAANLFSLTPQVRIDASDNMHLSLLTSVITDTFGMPIESGVARIEYNGKVEEVVIEDGLATVSITADELSSKDVRDAFGSRSLELNLEGVAGVTSLSRTNSMSLYLGDKDIALNPSLFEIVQAQSHVLIDSQNIFAFRSDVCSAVLVSSNQLNTRRLKTHRQADICYVQIDGIQGEQTIVFEDKGHTFGSFNLVASSLKHEVRWCNKSECIIQVVAPLNSKVEAKIFDENNQYVFQSNELENVVTINQNGLNPLKQYLVQVSFTNSRGSTISFYKTISGEVLNSLTE